MRRLWPRRASRLGRYFGEEPAALADVAHTLHVGRRAFAHRRFVVAATAAEAAQLLEKPDAARAGAREVGPELPEIAFLCPGQGSQYAGMGRGLYATEPAFRAAYDECSSSSRASRESTGARPSSATTPRRSSPRA